VIPGKAQMRHTLEQVAAFIGARAVTHYITQAPHIIPLALCILQNGLEGDQIRVNVRDYQNPH
jgi:hypothetical protein